jgi:hypothetical protein
MIIGAFLAPRRAQVTHLTTTATAPAEPVFDLLPASLGDWDV